LHPSLLFPQLNAAVLDPLNPTDFEPVEMPETVFCSGHTFTKDGGVVVVGGHVSRNISLPGGVSWLRLHKHLRIQALTPGLHSGCTSRVCRTVLLHASTAQAHPLCSIQPAPGRMSNTYC
jgi:hypothetical protein